MQKESKKKVKQKLSKIANGAGKRVKKTVLQEPVPANIYFFFKFFSMLTPKMKAIFLMKISPNYFSYVLLDEEIRLISVS